MAAYLYVHQNPNAPVRDNGLRFHGYPARSQRIRLIGVHTAESVFDQVGQDTGAEGVAAFQARTERPSSYHRIVDRDSVVIALPDEATAFGIAGLNSPTLHLSFALCAADWSDAAKARAAEPALRLAAGTAAGWCRRHGIPVRRLTKAQAEAGQWGFIAHGDADPDRRTDPGRDFPWSRFLQLVAAFVADPTTTSEEDDMPTADEVADAVVARLLNYPLPASGGQHLHAVLSNAEAQAARAVTLLDGQATPEQIAEATKAAILNHPTAPSGSHLHAVIGNTEQLAAQAVALLSAQSGATAQAIADAIPDDLARQVADELARRLQGA